MMKTLIVLVFVLALLEFGSAIECYTCNKGVCNATQVCPTSDACLSVTAADFKHKQCLKYSDCTLMKINQMFSDIENLKFKCCTFNLCNTGSLSVANHSLVGLLLSLALVWWGVH